MINDEQRQIADAAKRIYEEKLRAELEQTHLHQFVAIEPISGEYFLGSTLSEAIGAARAKHPTRYTHTLRVGHQATIHFGTQVR